MGKQAARECPEAGRAAGARRFHGRRDLPFADGVQRDPLPLLPGHRRAVPAGRRLPVVGSTFKNPDLARTYAELGDKGVGAIYRGGLGQEIVDTVNKPPVDPASGWNARPGDLSAKDLAAYRTKLQAPTRTSYRGLGVYSMAPSSSGGTTVGEALNILERTDLSKASKARYLHRFIEASRVAFADRGRWVGDPAFEDVPTKELLSQRSPTRASASSRTTRCSRVRWHRAIRATPRAVDPAVRPLRRRTRATAPRT
ncbi:hypothetical protein GCM10011428_34190 [Streptomyces violaceus]